MKKIITSVLTIFILSLTACGSANSTKSNSLTLSDTYKNSMPIVSQLIVGAYKLENTEQAISAEQAAELLPFWQVYESLSQSDNVAQAEVDALVKQIQETMTSGQIKAIKDMKLTSNEMSINLYEMGIASGSGKRNSGSSTTFSNGPAGGSPPGGGVGDPGGLGPEQIAPARVSQASGNEFGNNLVSSDLVDEFIKFLQQKAAL